MSRAVLSIGSNLGDRLAHLQTGVDDFAPWVVAVSPVFSTPPWGPVEQGDFLNAVFVAERDGATPADWLDLAHAAENRAGRIREIRWGPRTLDVDVIAVDDVISDDPLLTLPHPRAVERAFVLAPWWALDPEARMPGQGTVLELLHALPRAEVDSVRMVPGQVLRP